MTVEYTGEVVDFLGREYVSKKGFVISTGEPRRSLIERYCIDNHSILVSDTLLQQLKRLAKDVRACSREHWDVLGHILSFCDLKTILCFRITCVELNQCVTFNVPLLWEQLRTLHGLRRRANPQTVQELIWLCRGSSWKLGKRVLPAARQKKTSSVREKELSLEANPSSVRQTPERSNLLTFYLYLVILYLICCW